MRLHVLKSVEMFVFYIHIKEIWKNASIEQGTEWGYMFITLKLKRHLYSINENVDVLRWYLIYHIFTTLHMDIYIVLPFLLCLYAGFSLGIALSVRIWLAVSDYFFDILKLFLRSSRSKKGRQSNGKNKHDKGTNNDMQNTTKETKDWETWTLLLIGARSDEQFLLHKLHPFCYCLMARRRIAVSITQCTIEAYKLIYIGTVLVVIVW